MIKNVRKFAFQKHSTVWDFMFEVNICLNMCAAHVILGISVLYTLHAGNILATSTILAGVLYLTFLGMIPSLHKFLVLAISPMMLECQYAWFNLSAPL